jgi:MFS transporter, DHA1 family, tetracycline resistance protein
LFGMSAGIVGLLLLTLAPDSTTFWLGMPLMALWGFIGPSAQGLLTRLVGPDRQGQLQGAGASLMGVASLIGPALFTSAFALGIRPEWGAPLPGAPYLVAAVLLGMALFLAWRVTREPPEPKTRRQT